MTSDLQFHCAAFPPIKFSSAFGNLWGWNSMMHLLSAGLLWRLHKIELHAVAGAYRTRVDNGYHFQQWKFMDLKTTFLVRKLSFQLQVLLCLVDNKGVSREKLFKREAPACIPGGELSVYCMFSEKLTLFKRIFNVSPEARRKLIKKQFKHIKRDTTARRLHHPSFSYCSN
jgi:hypothetical protein